MKKTELDQTHRELIETAVNTAFATTQWQFEGAISGGLSQSVLYKISAVGKQFAVRLSDSQHVQNDLPAEYHAMRVMAKAGIAPQLYHADTVSGVAIMDFISSQPVFSFNFGDPAQSERLAQLVARMHNTAVFPTTTSIFDKTDFILNQIPANIRAITWLTQAAALKQKLALLLDDPDDRRPSHCDINPNNLLYDGQRLWLIDWGSAVQENLYFDLASCGNFFYIQNPAAEQHFLQAYFGRPPTTGEQEKYDLMRIFVSIYYGIMFLYISSFQQPPMLGDAEIEALPSYAHFMARLSTGEENMATAVTQTKTSASSASRQPWLPLIRSSYSSSSPRR